VKVTGRWRYVDRAIDQFGQVIDVFVSPRREVRAARRFFEQAIGTTKAAPSKVVSDRAPTYLVVLEELLPAAWHSTDRYANHHSRPITDASRPGCGRCAASSETPVPS
jgi:transposase, IS6 family